jgi:polar amino acid transport system substrate-binding protein
MNGRRQQLLAIGVLAIALPALAGCGSASDDAEQTALAAVATPLAAAPPSSSSSSSSKAPKPCPSDPTASLRPPRTLARPGAMPPRSLMARIRRRGVLKAGVDQNTLLLAYRQPATTTIQGFEVDLVREIARAILGDPNKVDLRAVTTDKRFDVVQSGDVDLLVDAATITCKRLREVAFSTVYFNAAQRVLVPADSTARSLADLGGRRVCATKSSTTLQRIKRDPAKPIPFPVEQRTDCLVALQEGRVAAISSDDAILLGYKAQDPNTKIVGPKLAPEPYGIAINASHPEFVRFVNGVLERLRRDGTWKALHHRWFGSLVPTPSPPRPHYRD